MHNPKRPHHQRVLRLLNSLSAELLETSACYFGGGTRIVLELGEYRESLDVDFLCANQDGYRELRNQVNNQSLGGIFAHQPTLLREVRADMYSIRTFVEIDAQPVKFEIIREDASGWQVHTYPTCRLLVWITQAPLPGMYCQINRL